MSTNEPGTSSTWIDPDDAPRWTEEMFRRAAIYDGDKLIRPATGTTTRDFTPDEMEARRRSEFVSLRLDRPVLEHFQATGPDWRDRINDVLRRIVDSAA